MPVPLKGTKDAIEKTEKLGVNIPKLVYSAFRDAPMLIDVAKCESRMRQFDKDGKVFRGEANPHDVGVMQINELYHLERAKKLGFNIHTPEGNVGYARFLYDSQGVQPWSASRTCWDKFSQLAKAN